MSDGWEEGLTSNKMGMDRTFYMLTRRVGIGGLSCTGVGTGLVSECYINLPAGQGGFCIGQ